MAIRIVQFGQPKIKGEGLRVGDRRRQIIRRLFRRRDRVPKGRRRLFGRLGRGRGFRWRSGDFLEPVLRPLGDALVHPKLNLPREGGEQGFFLREGAGRLHMRHPNPRNAARQPNPRDQTPRPIALNQCVS